MTTQATSTPPAVEIAAAGRRLRAALRAGDLSHGSENAPALAGAVKAVTIQLAQAQSWADAVYCPAIIHTAVARDQQRNAAARHAAARTLTRHARSVTNPRLRRELQTAAARHHAAALSLDRLQDLARPRDTARDADLAPRTGPSVRADDAPPPCSAGVEPKDRPRLLIAAPRAPQPPATAPCCGASPSRAPD